MRQRSGTASHRIANDFMEILEQQFPIESHHPIRLRYPSQFADRLHIHVNHLNRVLKETNNKTTTELIAQRILQEAKVLLRNSNNSVSDVAYVLGFAEPSHFTSFFKKHTQDAPTKYRFCSGAFLVTR